MIKWDATDNEVPWYIRAALRYRTKPSTRWRASTARNRAIQRALELLHHPTDWVKDDGDTWVVQCDRCGLWAGVTSPEPENEPTGYFGSILSVECKGPHTKPAWMED